MIPLTRTVQGVTVPGFIYGTAWKEDDTERLTSLAIRNGFRAIDTANQRKHYVEAAVGRAVQSAIQTGTVSRQDLFVQTKFTFARGQDHRLPYDPREPTAIQVRQSFESSQQNLGIDVIDSYLLHGPGSTTGLNDDDWAVWRAMESLQQQGLVRLIGVSNVSAEQLSQLCDGAAVKPAFVQNRCYAVQGWDCDVRSVCTAQDVTYQGFSLLTANRQLFRNSEMQRLAAHHQCSIAQLIFRFAIDVGMIPLTGTTSADHMVEDLSVSQFRLSADEVRDVETVSVR